MRLDTAGRLGFCRSLPTPQALTAAGKRKWEKFLHSHKLVRPQTYAKRMEIFARASEFVSGEVLTRTKSRLALTRTRMLRVLQNQIEAYRAEIEKLFAQQPDHDLFDSLPGAGPKIAPRLLSEIGSDRERFDCNGLQRLAGTAPVSYQSGQIHKVYLRRLCNKSLRATVHLWANLSRQCSPWAEVYYQALRARGKSHACALRSLGQRWLEDPLENVANPPLLRPRTPCPQPTQTRLVGPQIAKHLNPLRHVNNSNQKTI